MPGSRKSVATRRLSGAKASTKTRRSTSLSQLQAELRRAVARIAALEAVLRVTPQGDVTIAAAAGLTLQAAATVGVEGARITLDSGLVAATNVLRCDTLIATTVMAASYTPGAGNLV